MTANGLDIKEAQITRRPSRRYRPTSGHNTVTISQRTYIIIQRRENTRSHNLRANGKFNAWIIRDKWSAISELPLVGKKCASLVTEKFESYDNCRAIRRKTSRYPRKQTRRPHQLLFKLKMIPRASIIHFNEHSDRSSVGDSSATSFLPSPRPRRLRVSYQKDAGNWFPFFSNWTACGSCTD